jgi:hypothetical protein
MKLTLRTAYTLNYKQQPFDMSSSLVVWLDSECNMQRKGEDRLNIGIGFRARNKYVATIHSSLVLISSHPTELINYDTFFHSYINGSTVLCWAPASSSVS